MMYLEEFLIQLKIVFFKLLGRNESPEAGAAFITSSLRALPDSRLQQKKEQNIDV